MMEGRDEERKSWGKGKLHTELVDGDDTLRWDVGDGGFFKDLPTPGIKFDE